MGRRGRRISPARRGLAGYRVRRTRRPPPAGPASPSAADTGRRFRVAWIQQLKSRASTRVACDHGTSTAQVNLNQRKRSMPYDRKVAVDLPDA